MTLFFADITVTCGPDSETLSVEVPAADIAQTVAILAAWQAGLAVHERLGQAREESVSATKRRGAQYLTLREASLKLRGML